MFFLQGQTREDVNLHILALHPDLGLKKIGLWSRDRRGSAVIGDIKENIDQIRFEVLILQDNKNKNINFIDNSLI